MPPVDVTHRQTPGTTRRMPGADRRAPGTSRPGRAGVRLLAPVLALAALCGFLLPAPAARAEEDPAARGLRGQAAGRFTGWAFETCVAPPLETMRAWRASPYRAVGIYYAGRGRGCPRQPHLRRSWVREVHRMGWRLLPVFVGSQSPCVLAEHKRDKRMGRRPAVTGRHEARQAVVRARALGILRGSPLYLDVEAYRLSDTGCARATLTYVRAWNREVRRMGFVPGFYSSAESGVRHMERARRAGVGDLPEVMWFARWHTRPSLYGEPELHPGAWRPGRRIHQYAGNVAETHGGHRLLIDRNRMDAPVARVRP
ncbi:DUF1906 domain-containing protein [Streptomyces sp. NPDC001941]|uniref:DUF1906 domain-containing protein n=1 Tax=Streptomyces sp. NPDC001941 TaxID=3154659 RepID=UPI00333072AF